MFRRSLSVCLVLALVGCSSVTGGAPGSVSEPKTRSNIDCDLIFPAPGGM